MSHDPSYRNIDEKVQDAERYLIRRVDSIRNLVLVAVLLGVVAVGTSLWTLFETGRTGPGEVAALRGGSEERAVSGGGFAAPTRAAAPVNETQAATPGDTTETGMATPVESLIGDTDTETAPASAPVPDPATDRAEELAGLPATTEALSPAPTSPAPDSERAEDAAPPPSPPPPVTHTTERPEVAGEPAREWAFEIGASAVASEIIDLEPVGVSDRFSGQLSQLYCWTRIETDDFDLVPQSSRYVVHRWIHEGTVYRERTITIGSSSYRVYSALGTPGDLPGAWRVEIVDARGAVLGEVSFRIVS